VVPLGQLLGDVSERVHRAALLERRRPQLARRLPEAGRAVGDQERRRPHAAGEQVRLCQAGRSEDLSTFGAEPPRGGDPASCSNRSSTPVASEVGVYAVRSHANAVHSGRHDCKVSRCPRLPRVAVSCAAIVFVALVVGLSVLVGFVGPQPGFQWTLASVFGTALGTTLLAAGTGALAYLTWSEVGATQDLAARTKRDQDERERPLLIQYDAGASGSPDSGLLTVALFNAGLGPALRVVITATYQDDEHPLTVTHIHPAVAANSIETMEMRFSFAGNPPPGGIRGDGFALSGTYWDRSRRNEYPIITRWDGGQPEPLKPAANMIVAGKRTVIAREGHEDFELPDGHEISVTRDAHGNVDTTSLVWGDSRSVFFASMEEREKVVVVHLGKLAGSVGYPYTFPPPRPWWRRLRRPRR
jgi:hypothetical protein